MKTRLNLLLAPLAVAAAITCLTLPAAKADYVQTDAIVTLWAGQNLDAGTVTIGHDTSFVYVTYNTTGGWELVQTHLDVENSLEAIPQTGSGNPKPGKFAYSHSHPDGTTSYTYAVPIPYGSMLGSELALTIAAHAVVQQDNANGKVIQTQTGWADGLPFPGNNWATYVSIFIPLGG